MQSEKNEIIKPLMSELYAVTKETKSTLTPRNVTAELNGVIAQFDNQATDFADKNNAIKASIAELQQNGGDISAQLLQLGALAESQNQSQRGLVESTQSKLESEIGQLNGQLESLSTFLDQQKAVITEQANRLDQFDVTCQILDESTRGNSARIEALKESVQNKQRVIETQISGMDALLREHSGELLSLTTTTADLAEKLTAESQRLDSKIDGLDQTVVEHIGLNQTRFKWTWVSVALVCVLAITSFSLFKWNSAFAPTSTIAAVTGLDQRVLDVDQRVLNVENQFAVLPDKSYVTSLVSTQTAELAGSLQSQQSVISTDVTEMQRAVEDLRFEVRGPATVGPALLTPSLPIEGSAWLNSQDASLYTVQILSAYSYDDLVIFTNQNKGSLSDAQLSHTITSKGGRAMYSLFYGVSEFDGALNAIANFPLSIRVNQPFVRSVGSVQ